MGKILLRRVTAGILQWQNHDRWAAEGEVGLTWRHAPGASTLFDQTIAPARNSGDPSAAIGGWPKDFTKCGDLDGEIAFFDSCVRPGCIHKLFLADDLAA
jgi:hypothetical protein